jgi:hypothetical protein
VAARRERGLEAAAARVRQGSPAAHAGETSEPLNFWVLIKVVDLDQSNSFPFGRLLLPSIGPLIAIVYIVSVPLVCNLSIDIFTCVS